METALSMLPWEAATVAMLSVGALWLTAFVGALYRWRVFDRIRVVYRFATEFERRVHRRFSDANRQRGPFGSVLAKLADASTAALLEDGESKAARRLEKRYRKNSGDEMLALLQRTLVGEAGGWNVPSASASPSSMPTIGHAVRFALNENPVLGRLGAFSLSFAHRAADCVPWVVLLLSCAASASLMALALQLTGGPAVFRGPTFACFVLSLLPLVMAGLVTAFLYVFYRFYDPERIYDRTVQKLTGSLEVLWQDANRRDDDDAHLPSDVNAPIATSQLEELSRASVVRDEDVRFLVGDAEPVEAVGTAIPDVRTESMEPAAAERSVAPAWEAELPDVASEDAVPMPAVDGSLPLATAPVASTAEPALDDAGFSETPLGVEMLSAPNPTTANPAGPHLATPNPSVPNQVTSFQTVPSNEALPFQTVSSAAMPISDEPNQATAQDVTRLPGIDDDDEPEEITLLAELPRDTSWESTPEAPVPLPMPPVPMGATTSSQAPSAPFAPAPGGVPVLDHAPNDPQGSFASSDSEAAVAPVAATAPIAPSVVSPEDWRVEAPSAATPEVTRSNPAASVDDSMASDEEPVTMPAFTLPPELAQTPNALWPETPPPTAASAETTVTRESGTPTAPDVGGEEVTLWNASVAPAAPPVTPEPPPRNKNAGSATKPTVTVRRAAPTPPAAPASAENTGEWKVEPAAEAVPREEITQEVPLRPVPTGNAPRPTTPTTIIRRAAPPAAGSPTPTTAMPSAPAATTPTASAPATPVSSALWSGSAAPSTGDDDRLAVLRHRLSTVEQYLQKATLDFSQGTISEAMWQEETERWSLEREKLVRELAQWAAKKRSDAA